jgi:hypothetical protein
MIENINEELEKILFEANVTKAINTMLQCLLSEDETNCKKCKNCKNVDACYYLMESVFVCRRNTRKRTNLNM